MISCIAIKTSCLPVEVVKLLNALQRTDPERAHPLCPVTYSMSRLTPRNNRNKTKTGSGHQLSQTTLKRRHGAGQRVTHCRQYCWANHNPRPRAHVLPQPAFSPPCALSAQIIPHGTGKDSKEATETFTHTHTHICCCNNSFHAQPLKVSRRTLHVRKGLVRTNLPRLTSTEVALCIHILS